uniref:Uncharacterized protein n=2 Tax=Ciona intestinalis TaxID=7719 RepID=H2XTM3_CIOIN
MRGIVLITAVLCGVTLVCASIGTRQPEEMNEEALMKLAEISQQLESSMYNLTRTPTDLPIGTACVLSSDCGTFLDCINMVDIANDYMTATGHMNEQETIFSKANIRGKECAMNQEKIFQNMPRDEALQLIKETLEELDFFLGTYDEIGLNLREQVGTARLNFTNDIAVPAARSSNTATTNTLSPLLLMLALRGSGSSSLTSGNSALLLVALMSQQQQGTTGTGTGTTNNVLSNPFLLYT